MVKEDELIRLLCAGCDLRVSAAELKLSYQTVCKYARTPDFQDKLRAVSTEVWEKVDAELQGSKTSKVQRLEEAAEVALEEMLRLATESKSDMVRLKAAQDLMDRDPQISRTKRVESNSEHSFMNPLTLSLAARVAAEEDAYKAKVVEEERPARSKHYLPPSLPLPEDDEGGGGFVN